jgi:Putative Flp pilus-assembly TadE/G-like
MHLTQRLKTALTGERGDIPVLVVMLVPMMILMAGLVFDIAGKSNADREAATVAQAAARAGANAGVPSDPSGGKVVALSPSRAAAGARAYLAAAGLQGTVSATATRVTVEARKPYRTTFLAPIIPELVGQGSGVAEVRSSG